MRSTVSPDCHVTRPRNRFSRYSKWLDTFRTDLILPYDIDCPHPRCLSIEYNRVVGTHQEVIKHWWLLLRIVWYKCDSRWGSDLRPICFPDDVTSNPQVTNVCQMCGLTSRSCVCQHSRCVSFDSQNWRPLSVWAVLIVRFLYWSAM